MRAATCTFRGSLTAPAHRPKFGLAKSRLNAADCSWKMLPRALKTCQFQMLNSSARNWKLMLPGSFVFLMNVTS